jgi:hypothetical protein
MVLKRSIFGPIQSVIISRDKSSEYWLAFIRLKALNKQKIVFCLLTG